MTRRSTISLPLCQRDLIREIRGHAGFSQAELAACGAGDFAISKASIVRIENGTPVSFRVLRDLRAACKEALRRTRGLPEIDRVRLNHALDRLSHLKEPPNAGAVRPEVDPPWSMPLQQVSSRGDLDLFAVSLPNFREGDLVHLQTVSWIHPHDPIRYSYLGEQELLEAGYRATPSTFPSASMKVLGAFQTGVREWLSGLVDRESDGRGNREQAIRLGRQLVSLSKSGLYISLGIALMKSPEPSRDSFDPVWDEGNNFLIALAVAASLVDSITVSTRDPITEVIRLR